MKESSLYLLLLCGKRRRDLQTNCLALLPASLLTDLFNSASLLYKHRAIAIVTLCLISAMEILINILIGFLILNSILLVLIVLMQRPKNEGLGAAFGGGLTENIFGGQTSNVLTKFTTYLTVVFFGLSFLIAVLYARVDSSKSKTQQELLSTPSQELDNSLDNNIPVSGETPFQPSQTGQATPEQATPEQGTPEQGTPEQGTPEQGTSEQGTSEQETP